MNSYWNNTGTYQTLSAALNELVPDSGTVENPEDNPKLERFRKMSNAYYDLFNNGGGNPVRGTSKFFPGTITKARQNDWDSCYAVTEPKMDKCITAACKEQGLL